MIDPDYKKSFDEITAEITEAAKVITIGATYRHYKGMGDYKPVLFAIREEDNELCVVYQRVDRPELHFTRPVAEWIETVEWEGQSTPRFRLLQIDQQQ